MSWRPLFRESDSARSAKQISTKQVRNRYRSTVKRSCSVVQTVMKQMTRTDVQSPKKILRRIWRWWNSSMSMRSVPAIIRMIRRCMRYMIIMVCMWWMRLISSVMAICPCQHAKVGKAPMLTGWCAWWNGIRIIPRLFSGQWVMNRGEDVILRLLTRLPRQ